MYLKREILLFVDFLKALQLPVFLFLLFLLLFLFMTSRGPQFHWVR